MKEVRDRKRYTQRKLSNAGKRRVQVKWHNKNIALGTFLDEEASIICKRAQVFTKKMRSKRPKPSLEEVKLYLEGMGIRVVNERPGPPAKKKDSTRSNKKGHLQEEEKISAVYKFQQSYSPVSVIVPTPPHAIATVMMNEHPRIDSIANIIERGTTPPSYNKLQADSLMITPTESIKDLSTPSFKSNSRILPMDSHQGNNDPPVTAPRIKCETDSQVQGIGRVTQRDVELASDMATYQMLQKSYLKIKIETAEMETLMNFYKQQLQEGMKRENNQSVN